MAQVKTYLRSKFGIRIASLFVTCALVPIVLLSLVAFVQVFGKLEDQERVAMRGESRAVAQVIVERLTMLDRELTILSTVLSGGLDVKAVEQRVTEAQRGANAQPFSSIVLLDAAAEEATMLYGSAAVPPALTPEQRVKLDAEGSQLVTTFGTGGAPKLWMFRPVGSATAPAGYVAARIAPEYMWLVLGEHKPGELSQLCVIDEQLRVVYAYAPVSPAFVSALSRRINASSVDIFDWKEHGRTHYVGYRNVFLDDRFGVTRWTTVAARPADLVLGPLEPFRRSFPLQVLLCIWVVVLLTLYEVRKRLGPLHALIAHARQLGARDFKGRVEIDTGDEFEELGRALNAMAGSLDRQFHTLDAISKIDLGLLSSIDMARVMSLAATGLNGVFPGCGVVVALFNDQAGRRMTALVQSDGDVPPESIKIAPISEREQNRLSANPDGVQIRDRDALPAYLEPLRNEHARLYVVTPILVKSDLAGVVGIGIDQPTFEDTDADLLNQVVNQVALALSNARLVDALRSQHWGIVHALARAVDAKSHWTQGHSERVTSVSLLIAGEMGYDTFQLEELERGTLLHDVGKIGISNDILDKPGRLTAEERLNIQEHPRLGRRIIEPLGMSEEVVNIIAQHHERMDGGGYPLGLSGDAISLSARIVSVADVLDAVASDRPYRKGMPFPAAVELIKENAGTQFDATVVDVFASLVGDAQTLTDLLKRTRDQKLSQTPLNADITEITS